MAGFVYIMSNASFGSRIKIGKSDRDPIHRRAELSSTSVPEPFVLEYAAEVDDHHVAERKIHASLRHCRPNRGREFFEIPIPEAIALIRQSCAIINERVHYKSPEEIRRAEIAYRKRKQEQEERERLEREKNDRMVAWANKTNDNRDFQRKRFVEKRHENIAWMVGLPALIGVMAVVDYGWLAMGGVAGVAWIVYNSMRSSAIQDARTKFPHVTYQDYVEPSRNSNSNDRKTRVKCRGCEVSLWVPVGKHGNITCPRCRTSWTQHT
ncbi:MAG TPA: GIY-YIG nuclease family protein [Sphingomicrobium sp.]|nr:GIY-YIG nuclease family protein [Sphingomicrobium sp.]